MARHKLNQYVGSKRNSKRIQQKYLGLKQPNIKTIIETNRIKDSNDDDSIIMTVQNKTLDDSLWKDSFDRLLDSRSPLRKKNFLKKKVRLHYNLDSSINSSNEISTEQNHLSNTIENSNSQLKNYKKTVNTKENAFLNETPLYKQKSFLHHYDKVFSRNEQKEFTKQMSLAKKSTISSTPLGHTKTNRRKNSKSIKHFKKTNDLLFLPTISPIQNENSYKCGESLLNNINETERRQVLENIFGLNLSKSENDKQFIGGKQSLQSKAKRTILRSLTKSIEKNASKSKDEDDHLNAENNLLNNSNWSFFNSGNESSANLENFRTTKSGNGSNNYCYPVNYNSFTESRLLRTSSTIEDSQLNSINETNKSSNGKSFEKTSNSFDYIPHSISNKNLESNLNNSLSDIEKSIKHMEHSHFNSLSILENANAQENIDILNQSLQIIESAYESVLRNEEILTPEINEKFESIEKSLDNLISNNSSNNKFNSLNFPNESNTNKNKDENSKSQNPDSIEYDPILGESKKKQHVFENNAFINKLKFLQNCFVISGESKRRSLPLIKNKTIENLIRRNSTNDLVKNNTKNQENEADKLLVSKNLEGKLSPKKVSNQDKKQNSFDSCHITSTFSFSDTEIRPLRKSLQKKISLPINLNSDEKSLTSKTDKKIVENTKNVSSKTGELVNKEVISTNLSVALKSFENEFENNTGDLKNDKENVQRNSIALTDYISNLEVQNEKTSSYDKRTVSEEIQPVVIENLQILPPLHKKKDEGASFTNKKSINTRLRGSRKRKKIKEPDNNDIIIINSSIEESSNDKPDNIILDHPAKLSLPTSMQTVKLRKSRRKTPNGRNTINNEVLKTNQRAEAKQKKATAAHLEYNEFIAVDITASSVELIESKSTEFESTKKTPFISTRRNTRQKSLKLSVENRKSFNKNIRMTRSSSRRQKSSTNPRRTLIRSNVSELHMSSKEKERNSNSLASNNFRLTPPTGTYSSTVEVLKSNQHSLEVKPNLLINLTNCDESIENNLEISANKNFTKSFTLLDVPNPIEIVTKIKPKSPKKNGKSMNENLKRKRSINSRKVKSSNFNSKRGISRKRASQPELNMPMEFKRSEFSSSSEFISSETESLVEHTQKSINNLQNSSNLNIADDRKSHENNSKTSENKSLINSISESLELQTLNTNKTAQRSSYVTRRHNSRQKSLKLSVENRKSFSRNIRMTRSSSRRRKSSINPRITLIRSKVSELQIRSKEEETNSNRSFVSDNFILTPAETEFFFEHTQKSRSNLQNSSNFNLTVTDERKSHENYLKNYENKSVTNSISQLKNNETFRRRRNTGQTSLKLSAESSHVIRENSRLTKSTSSLAEGKSSNINSRNQKISKPDIIISEDRKDNSNLKSVNSKLNESANLFIESLAPLSLSKSYENNLTNVNEDAERSKLKRKLSLKKLQEMKNSNPDLLNKKNFNNQKRQDSNETIVHLSPEVSIFRKVREKSITLRKRLARSQLGKLNVDEENATQNQQRSIIPKTSSKLKKCKINIKKNLNIKKKLTTELNEKLKDVEPKLTNSNAIKKSKNNSLIESDHNLRRLRKCRINLKRNNIQNANKELKNFKNSCDNQFILPEIQINNRSIIIDDEAKINTPSISNDTTATSDNNSIMEITFDRDEFLRNIEQNQINYFTKKSSTLQLPQLQQSLTNRDTLNISKNIVTNHNDSINNSILNSNSTIPLSNVTLRSSGSLRNSLRKSQRQRKPTNTRSSVMYDTLHEDPAINVNNSLSLEMPMINENQSQLVLCGGKWRRSICMWKKNSISVSSKINSSQPLLISNNTEFLLQNQSTITNNKVEISNKENTECISSNGPTIHNNSSTSSNSLKSINKTKEVKHSLLRNSSLVKSIQNANEIKFNVSQPRLSILRKTLLLEPTDDEAPIIHTSCSLFNTFEKQSKSSSLSSSTETAASCIQENQKLQLPNQKQQSNNNQQKQLFLQQQNFIEKSLQRQQNLPPSLLSSTSIQYPEIVEEPEEEEEELQVDNDSEYNQSDGDFEYFNDRRILIQNKKNKDNENHNTIYKQQKSDEIQKFVYVQHRTTANHQQQHNHQQKSSYQHQLSVPICGNRQSSTTSTLLGQPSNRRRRTSFIKGFVDFHYQQEQRFLVDNFLRQTTTTEEKQQLDNKQQSERNQLQKSFNTNKSSSEFLTTDEAELVFATVEEKLICCPTLDVSLRAQLSPRDIVLRRCQQIDPFEFSSIYSESLLRQCRKIGEGVYGEVFMNKNLNGEAVVLKIIPIEGQFEVNGEVQKSFEQILPEIIIAEELSRLRNDKKSMTSGFVEVKNVHCVQGCYPVHLIELWELYRDNCSTENDHPEIFPDDQLYIVLELANAGQDLEAFNFQNALQSYSAFLQVGLSLAVAEEKFKFEHRDLHWGNILLSSTEQKEIYFKLNGKDYKVPTHGVKATIIDYTLSRMIFEGCCLYNDLSHDNELFSASGDYQFDVYRLMQKRLDNQWERYDPYTNILWLHYTIDKMISGARYRCSKTKKHRSAIQTMMKLRDELLDYNSASDYVETSFDN